MSETVAQDVVAAIYDALGGRPVLLPVETGTKKPFGSRWEAIDFDKTQAPDYQEELRSGVNIGVLLGAASERTSFGDEYQLMVVNVDSVEAALEWETLNPETAGNTLRTETSRGRLYWFWATPESVPKSADIHYPDALDAADRWGSAHGYGAQAVIHGTHPDGCEYATDLKKRPARIDFAKLSWPEGLDLPWRPSEDDPDRIAELYGEPYYFSANGALQINEPYWPAHYCARHRILFEPEENLFYQYIADRGLWKVKTESSIAHEFGRQIMDFAVEDPNAGSRLIVKRKSSLLNSLVSQMRGHAEKPSPFERQLGRIHVKNGMLNLKAEPPVLAGFSPSHYSRNQIPLNLDPEADCPRFKRDLLEAALPPEDIDVLQRYLGQCLLGVNLSQKILLLTGIGGTGKSTITSIIADIIGRDNVAELRTEQLNTRFEIFNYVGKNLLLGADVPGNFLQKEGAEYIKKLVGWDFLMAEPKHGKFSLDVKGDYNMIITSNSRLTIRLSGDASAYERRLIPVPYNLPPPEKKITDFAGKLLAEEGPGILNWMIEGARRVMDDWTTHGTFRLSKLHKQRVDDLLAESDSIRHFAKTVLSPTSDSEDVTKEEVLQAYMSYCEQRGWKAIGGNYAKTKLTDSILEIHRKSERHDIKRDNKSVRGYQGLRILKYEEE